MMSKKKKDKSDEPKKTKPRSSIKTAQDTTSAFAEGMSVTGTEVPARPKPRRTAATKKKTAIEISSADIALRAYYISEHRRNLNLPGDETGDWVEAERQLRKEAGKKFG